MTQSSLKNNKNNLTQRAKLFLLLYYQYNLKYFFSRFLSEKK